MATPETPRTAERRLLPESPAVMELRLPGGEFRETLRAALLDSIIEGRVVETIKAASEAAIALRGYVDKPQVAQYLGFGVRTIELWMKPETEGGLGMPHFKFGRADQGRQEVRFRLEAVDAWARRFELNTFSLNNGQEAA